MSVSKTTICLLCADTEHQQHGFLEQEGGLTQGRPKKYAFECELRFDPSISYKCLSGNLSFDAKASIRDRKSPSGSGDSLLKSGWMTVG